MRTEGSPPDRHDLAQCRVMLRHGSRTFHAASFLLPPPVRRAACALYAFCRLADDAVDLQADPHAALAELRERLAQIYEGSPWGHPADRALATVVRRYAIPVEAPAALLEGFEWDARCRRYRDLPELRAYGMRVAGTVGLMMALLMGVRRPDALARACDLGVAMQLTNIARDVGEDARAGRLYLPMRWLREEGIDAQAWSARPEWSPALGTVVGRLIEAAEQLYTRSAHGVAALPGACRPGINAARMLYREIGIEVQRRGHDSVTQRAVVSARRKAQVLVHAVAGAGKLVPRDGEFARANRVARIGHVASRAGEPPMPEAVHLIEAVMRAPAPEEFVRCSGGSVIPGFESRVEWTLDLFERLERRNRLPRPATLAAAARRPAG